MDPATIATAVVTSLIPFLVEGGKAAAKKGGEALIGVLERRLKNKPAAQEALDDVKKAPQNEDFQTVLRVQMEKILAADEALRAELTQLLQQLDAAPDYGVAAQGEGAAATGTVGGSVVSGGVKLEGGSTFVGGNQTTAKDDE